jgi:hypothetical protein
MNAVRRGGPFWRAREARIIRPEVWLMAVVVVCMLLVEVWQSARMTEVCVELTRGRRDLGHEQSRLAYERAQWERSITRTELEPLAARLDLRPMDASQMVQLPARFLAPEGGTAADRAPALAWLDGLSRAIVPEATARSRTGN